MPNRLPAIHLRGAREVPFLSALTHCGMGATGYESPKAAALAEWDEYRNAEVRVVEVRFTDAKNAVVVTDTEPSHPMKNYVTLTDDGWVFTADHD